MTSVQVNRLRERWWMRGGLIAMALLVVATGLCLFDQDEDGSGGGIVHPDLCLVMLLVTLAGVPLAGLLAAGPAVDLAWAGPYAIALRVPSPPPKLASLR
jgi:hypothetical protein